MGGCIPSAIKYGLIFTNSCVILMGVVTLGIGIFALSDGDRLADLIEFGSKALKSDISIELYSAGAVTAVVVSLVAIIVAFFGCCGAWKENRCLLFSYYLLLLVLFIGVIVSATIAFTQSLDILREPLLKSLSQYRASATDPESVEVTGTWDELQKKYKCCAVDGYLDWTNSTYKAPFPSREGYKVPESCCAAFSASSLDLKNCRKDPQNYIYKDYMDGCLFEFKSSLGKNKESVKVVTAIIILFMFLNLLVLFAFAMTMMPRREYQVL